MQKKIIDPTKILTLACTFFIYSTVLLGVTLWLQIQITRNQEEVVNEVLCAVMTDYSLDVLHSRGYEVARDFYVEDTFTEGIIRNTNLYREEAGVSPVYESEKLNLAAQNKAEDMANNGYFDHDGPDGRTLVDFIANTGYEWVWVGENLALGFWSADSVVEAWIDSPGHEQNILHPHYRDIGIGVAYGTFEGVETIFIVQMFGHPLD